MSVKIELDARSLQELDKAVLRAAWLTVEALETDVIAAQVMPFNTGTMQNTNTFTDVQQRGDKVEAVLITDSPQARRLYFHPEYNFQKINNPNAGGEWLNSWIDGNKKDFVPDTFAKFLKKEAGM